MSQCLFLVEHGMSYSLEKAVLMSLYYGSTQAEACAIQRYISSTSLYNLAFTTHACGVNGKICADLCSSIFHNLIPDKYIRLGSRELSSVVTLVQDEDVRDDIMCIFKRYKDDVPECNKAAESFIKNLEHITQTLGMMHSMHQSQDELDFIIGLGISDLLQSHAVEKMGRKNYKDLVHASNKRYGLNAHYDYGDTVIVLAVGRALIEGIKDQFGCEISQYLKDNNLLPTERLYRLYSDQFILDNILDQIDWSRLVVFIEKNINQKVTQEIERSSLVKSNEHSGVYPHGVWRNLHSVVKANQSSFIEKEALLYIISMLNKFNREQHIAVIRSSTTIDLREDSYLSRIQDFASVFLSESINLSSIVNYNTQEYLAAFWFSGIKAGQENVKKAYAFYSSNDGCNIPYDDFASIFYNVFILEIFLTFIIYNYDVVCKEGLHGYVLSRILDWNCKNIGTGCHSNILFTYPISDMVIKFTSEQSLFATSPSLKVEDVYIIFDAIRYSKEFIPFIENVVKHMSHMPQVIALSKNYSEIGDRLSVYKNFLYTTFMYTIRGLSLYGKRGFLNDRDNHNSTKYLSVDKVLHSIFIAISSALSMRLLNNRITITIEISNQDLNDFLIQDIGQDIECFVHEVIYYANKIIKKNAQAFSEGFLHLWMNDAVQEQIDYVVMHNVLFCLSSIFGSINCSQLSMFKEYTEQCFGMYPISVPAFLCKMYDQSIIDHVVKVINSKVIERALIVFQDMEPYKILYNMLMTSDGCNFSDIEVNEFIIASLLINAIKAVVITEQNDADVSEQLYHVTLKVLIKNLFLPEYQYKIIAILESLSVLNMKEHVTCLGLLRKKKVISIEGYNLLKMSNLLLNMDIVHAFTDVIVSIQIENEDVVLEVKERRSRGRRHRSGGRGRGSQPMYHSGTPVLSSTSQDASEEVTSLMPALEVFSDEEDIAPVDEEEINDRRLIMLSVESTITEMADIGIIISNDQKTLLFEKRYKKLLEDKAAIDISAGTTGAISDPSISGGKQSQATNTSDIESDEDEEESVFDNPSYSHTTHKWKSPDKQQTVINFFWSDVFNQWLDSLFKIDKAKVLNKLKYMQYEGLSLWKPLLECMPGHVLYEFKILKGYRIYFIQIEQKIYIIHAGTKKGQVCFLNSGYKYAIRRFKKDNPEVFKT